MEFYNITNITGSFGGFDHCKGDLRITTPGDGIFQWTTDSDAMRSMYSAVQSPRPANLGIRPTNTTDLQNIL